MRSKLTGYLIFHLTGVWYPPLRWQGVNIRGALNAPSVNSKAIISVTLNRSNFSFILPCDRIAIKSRGMGWLR